MFKTRKVKALESVISAMEVKIDRLTAENEKQKKMLSGERVCSGLCELCQNSAKRWIPIGGYYRYDCILDCKCPDFDLKTKTENDG